MTRAALALFFVAAFASRDALAQDGFPHDRHARLFIACATCHAGVTERGEATLPSPSTCTSCHDGVVSRRVSWTPRTTARPTLLRFTHDAHDLAVTRRNVRDTALKANCSSCHIQTGAGRMAVERFVLPQCLSCHGVTAPHFDAPASACATCHLPLTEARALTREQVAKLPKPSSHDAPQFALAEHGRLATSGGTRPIAASCTTCHARNLCVQCHVNAPDVPAIRALALDDRVPMRARDVVIPASHREKDFGRAHGRMAQSQGATCANCHARPSCESCHAQPVPRAVAALPSPAEGRAPGAQLTRRIPNSHTTEFIRRTHAGDANARARTCESCHQRATCLSCHRPENARQSAFHPTAFITRHPAAAYARQANCSDCHNPAQFCQSCHRSSGVIASAKLGRAGYHDAFRGFSLGHGQAARQSLESCASCHAERDCTACHSAVSGGFRFSPHGPGFDAARLRAKNPTLCIACHGSAIPR